MFNWNEFLELAEDLFNDTLKQKKQYSSELRLRNCVSRAYYSTYCQTRNFCERKGIFSPQGKVEDHHDLIEACKSHGNFDVKGVGKNLHWLRDRRNDCDYEDDLTRTQHSKNLQTTADDAIDRAYDVIKELKKLEDVL